MTWLELVQHALSSSSIATDLQLRALYVASARARVDAARSELEAVERLVSAQERELLRVAGAKA